MKGTLTLNRSCAEPSSDELDFDLREALRKRFKISNCNSKFLDQLVDELEDLAFKADKNLLPFDVAVSKMKAAIDKFSSISKPNASIKAGARYLNALASQLLNKLIVKRTTVKLSIRANSGLFISLIRKLKPTNDGKDASIDNQAAIEKNSSFINTWNLYNAQTQNHALN